MSSKSLINLFLLLFFGILNFGLISNKESSLFSSSLEESSLFELIELFSESECSSNKLLSFIISLFNSSTFSISISTINFKDSKHIL